MRILLAADGSNASIRAAHTAAGLVRQHPQGRLTILYVVPASRRQAVEMAQYAAQRHPGLALDPSQCEELDIPRMAEPVHQMLLQELNLPADKVETLCGCGNPTAEILRAAQTGLYDLIVMGRRGANPLTELVMGSVSSGVLHRSPVPVMVVN